MKAARSSRRTPSRRTAKPRTPKAPIPPPFTALLHFLDRNPADPAEVGRAVLTARHVLDAWRNQRRYDTVANFITDAAARGSWAELHARLEALDGPSEHDPNWYGDYINVYGNPALLIGLAVGYLYAAEGQR